MQDMLEVSPSGDKVTAYWRDDPGGKRIRGAQTKVCKLALPERAAAPRSRARCAKAEIMKWGEVLHETLCKAGLNPGLAESTA
jgi:hypothetical protein